MKALALLLLSLSTFAADKTETIRTHLRVRILGIACTVRAGEEGRLEDRLRTQLGEAGEQAVLYGTDLALTHGRAVAPGCDLAKLDRIVQGAELSFGFLRNAPAEITRITSAPYRTQDGQCLQQIDETATVDIGEGLQLISREGRLRAAKDCP